MVYVHCTLLYFLAVCCDVRAQQALVGSAAAGGTALGLHMTLWWFCVNIVQPTRVLLGGAWRAGHLGRVMGQHVGSSPCAGAAATWPSAQGGE
jgi:hypothetical protein